MPSKIFFLLLLTGSSLSLAAEDSVRIISAAPPASALADAVPRRPEPPEPPPDPVQSWIESWEVEGLPPDAPREGVLITVDTTRNVLYLFRDAQLVGKAPAATGLDKMLTKGMQRWLFRTPRGIHPVVRKIVDPVWVKPDWAYVEEGKRIPPPDHPSRRVPGKLGKFALDLGDGIMIHGTKELNSLGKKASHGCIRLGPDMLSTVYREASVGTPVYIF